jgi:hypothetical protein
LPEALLRRAKVAAAMRGRKCRELVVEGLERVLNEPGGLPGAVRVVSAFDLARERCGAVESGIGDLSCNPEHLQRFGRASASSR